MPLAQDRNERIDVVSLGEPRFDERCCGHLSARRKENSMYIGGGVLAAILIIALLIYLL